MYNMSDGEKLCLQFLFFVVFVIVYRIIISNINDIPVILVYPEHVRKKHVKKSVLKHRALKKGFEEMREKTVTLLEPIEIGGNKLSQITVRSSVVGDEEDAMQDAVRMKRAKNPVTIELCLLARASRVPYDVLRSMNGQDYAALRGALNELNGFSTEEDAPFLTAKTETVTETDTTPKSA